MQFNVSDKTTIGYEIYGEGKPLVFLPGILGSTKTYDLVLGDIPKKRKCIVIELAGQGETSFSDNRDLGYFTVEQHTQNIIKLLDHLKVKDFDLIGLSFGSVISINLAQKMGTRIDKLILLATLLCNNTAHYKNWNTLWGECSHDLEKFTRMGIGLLFSEQFLLALDDPYGAIYQIYTELTDSHLEAFRYNLASASDFNIPPAFEKLSVQIKCIHGEVDVIHPLHEINNYLTSIGKEKILDVIPNAGHGIHIETPDIVCDKICEFLNL